MAEVSLSIWGFPTELSEMIFALVCDLRIMVSAFLNFQPNLTGIKHVLGKFGHYLGFTFCLTECSLDVLYSTTYAPREELSCLSQDRFLLTLNEYIHTQDNKSQSKVLILCRWSTPSTLTYFGKIQKHCIK